MTKTNFLASAAVAAALLASGAGNAAMEKFDISTTYNGGTYSGDVLTGYFEVDVNGSNVATSGTLSLSGPGLAAEPVTLGLVPVDVVYEAGDGTELFGNDNVIPITANGITFGTNAPDSARGGYTVQFLLGGEYGECSGTVVCGMIAGPGGTGNLYDKLGATTITPAAIPELSTWAMLGVGFAGLAFAGFRKSREARAIAD